MKTQDSIELVYNNDSCTIVNVTLMKLYSLTAFSIIMIKMDSDDLEFVVHHFTGCPQSYFPLTTLTLTPGKSLVLPPSTNTTLCSCKVCPSRGMNAIISFPLLRRTRQHLRLAEFGFLGFLVRTCSTMPFICGLPLMGPRGVGFRLTGPFLMIWF